MSSRRHHDVPVKREEAQGAPPANSGPARRVHSRELVPAGGQLVIEHAGREYRLRVTSNGKLILTA